MTEWNPELARLRQQLAQIALIPDTLQARAEAVLAVLGRILPSDAAWLAVRDPEARRHTPLATAGDAEPLRRNFQRPDADDEVEWLGLNRHRPPMLASEYPSPLTESPSWAEHLLPAGFRGGVAAGLFTPGGRHVGFLSLLSGEPTRPGPADRQLIDAVAPVIAHALDRSREIAETARIVAAALAGVVLTRAGDTLPLPGLPDHRLLAPGSSVLTAAAGELADADVHISFLVPDPGDGRLLRVTALECGRPELDHLAAVVLLSPPGDLRGLTPLHLRLLGSLVEGATHAAELATVLGVEERTAADALRTALIALETTDLTAAAARAVRAGLRIPPRMATPA